MQKLIFSTCRPLDAESHLPKSVVLLRIWTTTTTKQFCELKEKYSLFMNKIQGVQRPVVGIGIAHIRSPFQHCRCSHAFNARRTSISPNVTHPVSRSFFPTTSVQIKFSRLRDFRKSHFVNLEINTQKKKQLPAYILTDSPSSFLCFGNIRTTKHDVITHTPNGETSYSTCVLWEVYKFSNPRWRTKQTHLLVKKKEKSFQEFKSLDKWLELQFLLDAVKVSFISHFQCVQCWTCWSERKGK